MKKLDIPCGEGCVAIIMNEIDLYAIRELLQNESISRKILMDNANRLEKEFDLAAGFIKEPEKPAVDPESNNMPF
jgi:hypothetical protein